MGSIEQTEEHTYICALLRAIKATLDLEKRVRVCYLCDSYRQIRRLDPDETVTAELLHRVLLHRRDSQPDDVGPADPEPAARCWGGEDQARGDPCP